MLGIFVKFRGVLLLFIIYVVNNCIDVYVEKINCYLMEIRRYYC